MGETVPRRMTMAGEVLTRFTRPKTGLSLVGVLSPVDTSQYPSQVRIEKSLLIGRGRGRDGIDLSLADDNASRCHARIRRTGNRFLIEDLGSSNGTFVDGMPVRWAQIHDGDKIRIGRTMFYFDHCFEFERDTPAKVPASEVPAKKPSPHDAHLSVRFWGTRGSLPTPGSSTQKYGGNTTCVEVRYGDAIVVIDAGSGIREMSRAWADEFADRPLEASLLFTHLHWDHIQGFPFFAAAYAPQNSIHIYGPQGKTGNIRDLLSGQMQRAYFPVPFSELRAGLDFSVAEQKFSVGEIQIETFGLPHPGGSLGYRFTAGDSVFVFATDSELDQIATNQDELKVNHFASRKYPSQLTDWMSDADLLVIDCQYTDDEYLGKIGWGHNSITTVVDLCDQVRPKKVGLFHHDPMSTDSMVTKRIGLVADRLADRGIHDILVFGAREQLCVNVKTAQIVVSPDSLVDSDVTLKPN